MNNTDKILLHFTLIPGIGPTCVQHVLSYLGNDRISEVYMLTQYELTEKCGLQIKQAQLLAQGLKNFDILEKECELLEKHDFVWVSCFNGQYPALLKEIHVPPIGLYIHGKLPSHAIHTIGIVGARKSNNYAQKIINQCVPDFVAHGWSIISGGALGADTMAHEATLRAGGITVAVLGSGLMRPYPYKNKSLFSRIVDAGGAVVSPFPLTMEGLPGNFPARNRIISGMSRGCIVVQAGEKSGAIITAYCALEQGRDVFAVPGPLDDPLSAGCHALLRQGAVLMRDAKDVFMEFGYSYRTTHKENIQKEIIFTRSEEEIVPEDEILMHCRQPISVDELLEKTGLPLSEIYNRLSSLQLEGKIEQNFIGLWQMI